MIMAVPTIGIADGSAPLNDISVDFSNDTQASDVLGLSIDESEFQVIGNQYNRDFWYGVIVTILFAAIGNLVQRATLQDEATPAAAHRVQSARHTNLFTKSAATFTTVCRKASYLQVTLTRAAFWLKLPPHEDILLFFELLGFYSPSSAY